MEFHHLVATKDPIDGLALDLIDKASAGHHRYVNDDAIMTGCLNQAPEFSDTGFHERWRLTKRIRILPSCLTGPLLPFGIARNDERILQRYVVLSNVRTEIV